MGQCFSDVAGRRLLVHLAHERMAVRSLRASTPNRTRIENLLGSQQAFLEGIHVVYKSGRHGTKYINKELFAKLGGADLMEIFMAVAQNAFLCGIEFKPGETVTLLGTAYGAINYATPVCASLEEYFRELGVTFIPGRTQLRKKADGKTDEHYFPDKLIEIYSQSDSFCLVDDITNGGTTNREVGKLCLDTFGKPLKYALSIFNRGGQTAESMGLEGFYPYFDVNMEEDDPRSRCGCPDCKDGKPIDTVLGKGASWVEMFGQPPYAEGMDFSAYPFADPIREK